MLKNNFLPESMYQLDSSMTLEKLYNFYCERTTITGKVRKINSASKLIEIELGNNFLGFMSFEEATIYSPYKQDGSISPALYLLVGKTIRVRIISFDSSTQSPFLSRKENMLETLTVLKNTTNTIYACITAFSKHSAFMDIGGGINGRANTNFFATTRFRDVRDIGFHIGDIIPIKILSFLDEEMKFNVSRIAALPPISDVLSVGDVVTAQVFEPVNDEKQIGYYVQVDRSFNGIVDSPDIPLRYGQQITVFIKKIKEDGNLKLSLVKNY